MQDFAEDLRTLFTDADALNVGDLMRPGADPQIAAASMASDAGVNKLLLQVSAACFTWVRLMLTHALRIASAEGTDAL